MWPLPNPIDLFGDVVGGAVGWAWDKVIQGIYTWFAGGFLVLLEWVWGVIDTTSSPRLTEAWFANDMLRPVAGIALSITVAMMLASAIQAGLGGRPELIVDALKEGPKAIFATSVTVIVMDVMLRGADAISDAVWLGGRGDTQLVLDGMADLVTKSGGVAVTFLGPLSLLFGMIGLAVISAVLMMRSALLYLVAAFAPIVWASSVSPVMRGSGRRLVHITVALVLAKPAITITLSVGMKLMANTLTPTVGEGGSELSPAAALGTLMTGFTCITIAGLSPWVIYRLLPSVEQAAVSSGIVGGWGRTAMTAAQAGLMVKSLGASAATRPLMSQSAFRGYGYSNGGSGESGNVPPPQSAANGRAGGGGAATASVHRPPVPPDTQPPPQVKSHPQPELESQP